MFDLKWTARRGEYRAQPEDSVTEFRADVTRNTLGGWHVVMTTFGLPHSDVTRRTLTEAKAEAQVVYACIESGAR